MNTPDKIKIVIDRHSEWCDLYIGDVQVGWGTRKECFNLTQEIIETPSKADTLYEVFSTVGKDS